MVEQARKALKLKKLVESLRIDALLVRGVRPTDMTPDRRHWTDDTADHIEAARTALLTAGSEDGWRTIAGLGSKCTKR